MILDQIIANFNDALILPVIDLISLNMINFEALFKISYGLYIVCSGDDKERNGYISNTVFQVTSQPPKFASCCNKDNYTCSLIEKSGHFSVSVLHQGADADIIGGFGYRSGKDIDKFEGVETINGQTGVPIVLNDCVAFLECRVVDRMDVGTHVIFIGELVDAQVLEDTLEPITYAFYRNIRKGVAPKNAPTYVDKSLLGKGREVTIPEEGTPAKDERGPKEKYQCPACGYIYDENEEEDAFHDLPDSWSCPVCGVDKEDFMKV